MQADDTLSVPQEPSIDLSDFIASLDEAPKQEDRDVIPSLAETGKAVVSGVRNGAAELVQSAGDLNDYIYGRFGVPTNPTFKATADALRSDFEPETFGGAAVQGVSQFATAFAGIGKLTKPLNFIKSLGKSEGVVKALGFAGTAVKGAAAEAVGFDPHQARLSNLLQDMGVDNSLVNSLAANPEDTNLQGRAKAALEGLGAGFVFDGVIKGLKTVGTAAKSLPPDLSKKVSEYVYNTQTAQWLRTSKSNILGDLFKSNDPVVQSRLTTLTNTGGPIDKMIKESETAATTVKSGINTELPQGIQVDIEGPKPQKFSFTPEQAIKVADNINKPGPLEEIIKTSNMSGPDDVLRAINATAKVLQDSGKISKEVQTWEQTGNLADILQTDKKTLFQNLQAIGGSTEEVAAHLEAANSFMQGLASKVSRMSRETELTPDQIAEHVQTINILANVTAQYRGISKNLGRGLQILRKNKLPADGIDVLDVNDVMNTPEGRLRYQQMAKLISTQGGDIAGLSRLLSPGSRAWMAFNEYYINNLLSSPTTTTVNTVTGALNSFLLPAEKTLAAMFKGDITEVKASSAAYKGIFDGMLDAVKLFSKTQEGLEFDPGPMWKVLRSGRNILDNQNSLESQLPAVDSRFLFNVDPNDLKGTQKLAANIFDTFGKFVRLPSHAIAASDELLKTMATRSEMNRQLYIEGSKLGLSSNALQQHIKNGLENPTKEMWENSVRFARETTFTQDLPSGGVGRKVQQAVSNHPWSRLFIPFVRTPINIMKFTFTRTPGINLLVKEARQELKNDPSMFMAKMATGTALYTAAYALGLEGKITGAGPKNKGQREAWLAAGNQPYSVKIGDTWHQYNRLDPFGSFFGMAADSMDLVAKSQERDADELVTILLASVAKNVTSKTFLRGLSDAIAAVSDGDPKKGEKVIGNILSGSVPFSSALNTVNRVVFEDSAKETFDLMDKLAARIPGLSEDLPPVRNIWGEEVQVPTAIGPDLLSPFYAKTPTGDFKEKVAEEIVRLDMDFGKPDKYVGNPPNRFEFTPEQYDRLVVLMGNDIEIKGKNMPEMLHDLINSDVYKNKLTDGTADLDGTRASEIRRIRQAFLQTAHEQLSREVPDYAEYRKISQLRKNAVRRSGGDQILQQLSLPAQ